MAKKTKKKTEEVVDKPKGKPGKETVKKLKKAVKKAEETQKKAKAAGKRKKDLENIDKEILTAPSSTLELYKEILNSRLYKMRIAYAKKSDLARDYIDAHTRTQPKNAIIPGMMLMFNYFKPATEEELKYWDAMPCTIFFGVVMTEKGKRVIGFNLHYYPPRLRYQLLGFIFRIFRADYIKGWENGPEGEIPEFNYRKLMDALKQKDLDFGVRMYIPALMSKVRQVQPKYFQVAVFSEGVFRKQTREQILKYWQGKVKVLF